MSYKFFLQTFCDYCENEKLLQPTHDWPEFTFTPDGQKLELIEPQATSGWVIKVQSRKNMV